VKHVEYFWKASDGVSMFGQSWAPDAGARAAIALVHGLGEHSGRYPRLVERLQAAGYAVNAFDLRGHGRSSGPRLFARSYETLMQDIQSHIDQTRQRFPGLPVFLYGHSLGGAQVLSYALRRTPPLAGVIASSPLLAPGTAQSSLKLAAGRLVARIFPTAIFPTGVPLEGISRDPAVRAWTREDPLYQDNGVSARLGTEFLAAGKWISSQTRFPLPLLVMQGTDDHHVDPKATIEFAERLTADVTLKVWENGRHELHNDLDKDAVIDFVLAWLGRHE
jgi:alpha-beta hydrolase superfamily lysophospholipase